MEEKHTYEIKYFYKGFNNSIEVVARNILDALYGFSIDKPLYTIESITKK